MALAFRLEKAGFNTSEPRDEFGKWSDGLVTASHSPIIQGQADEGTPQPLTGSPNPWAPKGKVGGKSTARPRKPRTAAAPTGTATAYWGGKPKHFAVEAPEPTAVAPQPGDVQNAATPAAVAPTSARTTAENGATVPTSAGIQGVKPPEPPMTEAELDRAIGLKPKPPKGDPASKDADQLPSVKPGDEVDGLTVRDNVSNTGSISASLYDYHVVPGIREVSMSHFDTSTPSFYSKTEKERTESLAAEIKDSGEIEPLIVVFEPKTGKPPYVLEGGHRFDALQMLGHKSFPAMVVVDDEEPRAPNSTPPAEPPAEPNKIETSKPAALTPRQFQPDEIENAAAAFHAGWRNSTATPEALLTQRGMNVTNGRDPDAGLAEAYGDRYHQTVGSKDPMTEIGHSKHLTGDEERRLFEEAAKYQARQGRTDFQQHYGDTAQLFRGLSPREVAMVRGLKPGDTLPDDRPLISAGADVDEAGQYSTYSEPGNVESEVNPGREQHVVQYQNVTPEDAFASYTYPDDPGTPYEAVLQANRRPWKLVGTREDVARYDDPATNRFKGDKRTIYSFEPGVPEPWRDDPYTKSGKVEQVPVDWLRAHQGNPTDPGSVRELKADLERNGVQEPVIIGFDEKAGKGYVVEGNHRVAAAHALGWTHLPARANRMKLDGFPAAKPLALKVKPNEHGYVPADLRPSEAIDFAATPGPRPPAPIDDNHVNPPPGMLQNEYAADAKLPPGKIVDRFTTKNGAPMVVVRRDMEGDMASNGDVVLSAHPYNDDGSIGSDVGFIGLEGDFDPDTLDEEEGKAAVAQIRTNSHWQRNGIASKLADVMHSMYPKGVDYGLFTEQGKAWHENYLNRLHHKSGDVIGAGGGIDPKSLSAVFQGQPEPSDVVEGALMAYNKGSKRAALEVLKDNPDFAHQVAQTSYHTNALAAGAATFLTDVTGARWKTASGVNGMVRVKLAKASSTPVLTKPTP